jgi:multiple sugar transport system ATP-binding protein
MAEIQVENLNKRFGDYTAVRDSSFTVANGDFFVMVGPSGCGKTTTLRMIAGLEWPSDGRILLDGEDVSQKRASARDIAFVFQLFALYPHMNVRRNMAFPLICEGVGAAEVKRRVEDAAQILRIDHLLNQSVSRLAGGDRQRVALGRAIVRQPKAFLMDEPLGALDAEMREAMIGELRALHNRLGATTIYVTHDQLEAMAMADQIAVMNNGLIEQCAPPQELYDRPASLFVAGFIGSPGMNLLPVTTSVAVHQTSVRFGSGTVEIPACLEAFEPRDLLLGARPEHVRLADDGPLQGEVFGTEYLGTTQIVTVTTGLGPVKARLASAIRVEPGERVALAFRPEKLSLFDAGSGRPVRTVHSVGGGAHG